MLSDNPRAGIYEADTSRTLDQTGGAPDNHQGGIAVVEAYSIQGNMIGRKDGNGPQGAGINKDVSFTLNTTDKHAVFAMTTGSYTQVDEELSPPLMARDYKDPTIVNEVEDANETYRVRRLTPLECCRLQGFPDWWCSDLGTENPTEDDIAFWTEVFETFRKLTNPRGKPKSRSHIIRWLKNPYTEAAEYRMWGNGVALPVVYFIMCGIVWAAGLPAIVPPSEQENEPAEDVNDKV